MSNNTSPPPIQDQSIGENMNIIKNSIGNIGNNIGNDIGNIGNDIGNIGNDIGNDIGNIGNNIGNIGNDIKTGISNATGNVVGFVEDPIENIEKLINSLRHVPLVLEQIVEDSQFIPQIKVISLTLAQALSESVEIMTPYMITTTSTLITKLARAGFLGVLDAAGVIPFIGEIIESLLIVQDIVMTVLNVTRASVQVTDISVLLLDNLVRIYKKNEQKVKANHGRVINSVNNFQNTNNPNTQQEGGKKMKSKTKPKL